MIWRPNVTVAAVVERDGRFLMVEEAINGELLYNQPAGHLDEGESLLTAVIRETLEETAWHFKPEYLVGLYQWKSLSNGITYLRVSFTGSCHNHQPERVLDSGITRALWLTQAELAALSDSHRSPMVTRCVADYLTGARYPLDLLGDLGQG